ncbi:hypothetical protein CEP52_016973 [Fusarium oligoseptatum]|uniref:Uncharacterized protein n=1 Tax=Fusarium oligoseptatum TaxID=2604345 RepID=A0A428RXY1_9HYPO|nr:hypothetical protein CEP52_016973 [Fusarium oligoseptatum]
MSRLALQSAQASASASAPASDFVDVATTTPVETTTPAFGFDHHNHNRAASPSDVPVDDSPTVGRIKHSNPAVPSLGSLSSSGPRSPRPAISSPLATSLNFPFGPTTPSPRSISFPLRQTPTPTSLAEQSATRKTAIVRQTSFYSDSSDEGSPEPRSPRLGYLGSPNELRTVSDPVTLKPSQGSISNPRPAMAGPVAATQAESSKSMPRNSSIDSAISAISIKSGPNGNQDGQHGASDIANLIKTAGSPEALIQYLLKEKHSQSQQNGQLWRLVDKQRAMILGLNKDLERALKDKEKVQEEAEGGHVYSGRFPDPPRDWKGSCSTS